jgi:hypothetical protein
MKVRLTLARPPVAHCDAGSCRPGLQSRPYLASLQLMLPSVYINVRSKRFE